VVDIVPGDLRSAVEHEIERSQDLRRGRGVGARLLPRGVGQLEPQEHRGMDARALEPARDRVSFRLAERDRRER
jgi:hypothetical protein